MMQTPDPPTNHPSAPIRVLAADPDEKTRSFYRHAFSDDGCDVVEASDGRDALVKALVRVPALVITELRLPEMSGLEFCEILRRDHTTAHVPIVIATKEIRAHEIERARAVANVVLAKPTHGELLMKHCALLLAQSHTLRGRLAELAIDTAETLGVSATALRIAAELRQGRERTPAVKAHMRFITTAPPSTPPVLTCPSCGRALAYEVSYIGGVNEHHPEQWDYFICGPCGTFQFRHRTRKLRQLRADEERWMQRMRSAR